MESIYNFVQQVAKNTLVYSDSWKPWRDQSKVHLTKGTQQDDDHEAKNATKQQRVNQCIKSLTPRPSKGDTDGLKASLAPI